MIPTREEWFAALEARHGKDRQARFSRACVAVCGLGGLGSNIAVSLARAGVGKLILIDFDRVDISNLNRQQYKSSQLGEPKTEALAANLREIAPYVTLETHDTRLSDENAPTLLAGADVVCEAFDRAEEKAMLANAVLTRLPGKTLVAASGMAGLGSPNAIQTRRVTDKFYLCGDGESDVAREGTLYAPRVALCAAHEATTVLRILAGLDTTEREGS